MVEGIVFNPLNAELNPIRHLLALVGARHFVHFSRIRVNESEGIRILIRGGHKIVFARLLKSTKIPRSIQPVIRALPTLPLQPIYSARYYRFIHVEYK
jgi:hypothetical protein